MITGQRNGQGWPSVNFFYTARRVNCYSPQIIWLAGTVCRIGVSIRLLPFLIELLSKLKS